MLDRYTLINKQVNIFDALFNDFYLKQKVVMCPRTCGVVNRYFTCKVTTVVVLEFDLSL